MSPRPAIEARVERALAELQTDRVLVCLSGGLDSRVLLEVCHRLAPRLDVQVCSVHVHHGMRPSADEDAAFCARLTARRGIPHRTEHVEVSALGSTQGAARLQRWAAIAEVASRWECAWALSAHHADDVLETALLQMMRGAGAQGISSLARPHAPAPGARWLQVARPLLECTREEIQGYARARGLAWVEDPSNATDAYQRNRVRHHALPALLAEHGAREGLTCALESLRREADWLLEQARALEARAWRAEAPPGSAWLDRAALAEAAQPVRARLLLELPGRLGLSGRWGREHVEMLGEVLDEPARAGHLVRLSVPGGVVEIDEQLVCVWPGEVADLEARQARSLPLPIGREPEGQRVWFDAVLGWATAPGPPRELPRGANQVVFDRRALPDQLVLRAPYPGEELEGFGGRRHAAREVMRQAGAPARVRWRWPCVALPDGPLLWVCGGRRSGLAPVGRGSAELVKMWARWRGPEEK